MRIKQETQPSRTITMEFDNSSVLDCDLAVYGPAPPRIYGFSGILLTRVMRDKPVRKKSNKSKEPGSLESKGSRGSKTLLRFRDVESQENSSISAISEKSFETRQASETSCTLDDDVMVNVAGPFLEDPSSSLMTFNAYPSEQPRHISPCGTIGRRRSTSPLAQSNMAQGRRYPQEDRSSFQAQLSPRAKPRMSPMSPMAERAYSPQSDSSRRFPARFALLPKAERHPYNQEAKGRVDSEPIDYPDQLSHRFTANSRPNEARRASGAAHNLLEPDYGGNGGGCASGAGRSKRVRFSITGPAEPRPEASGREEGSSDGPEPARGGVPSMTLAARLGRALAASFPCVSLPRPDGAL